MWWQNSWSITGQTHKNWHQFVKLHVTLVGQLKSKFFVSILQHGFVAVVHVRSPTVRTCSLVHPLHLLKPWRNRIVSRCNLKTWVYLQLHLASPCKHLRWLAYFDQDQICVHVFHHLATQPKSTQVEWHPFTNYQPMKCRICLPWNGFLRLARTCKPGNLSVPLATPWVSKQEQVVATCKFIWPGLNASFFTFFRSYAGRPPAASTATGNKHHHNSEQEDLINQALD